MCVVDAVAGGQHLALPQDLPAVLIRGAVLLPAPDARGETCHTGVRHGTLETTEARLLTSCFLSVLNRAKLIVVGDIYEKKSLKVC